MNVAVIGGGAAGYFAAIAVKENYPAARVTLFEKSGKSLAKVRISGGGRCNVTNGNTALSKVVQAYPRGKSLMKRALKAFSTKDTMEWFENRGVPLFIQDDMRVFPASEDSASIVECLEKTAEALNVQTRFLTGVKTIVPKGEKNQLTFTHAELAQETFDKVIVASGGSPKTEGLEWLKALGHEIIPPVPSLFTFNIPDEPIVDLRGISIDPVQVSIPGTKFKTLGPLLITHWGFSGPAILQISAFGARALEEMNYQFEVGVNWIAQTNHDLVVEQMQALMAEHGRKQLSNMRPFGLPERFWQYILDRSGIPPTRRWNELGKKGLNKLVTMLTNDSYAVSGKTTFKEEFVTCGGISLDSIDGKTMGSKVCKNLYFAGEILDIDGITGGYNFQAAWTTAFIAAKLG